jgi:hypothetical protein
MCAVCGCGYATYDDIETGAPGNPAGGENEATERSEAN